MRSFIVSFLLHALAIGLLAFKLPTVASTQPPMVEATVEVVDSPKPPAKRKQVREIAPAGPNGMKPCEHSYGGIGIYAGFDVNGMTTIDKVMPGYAAEASGLRDGDVIIDGLSTPLLGEVGGEMVVVVVRGSQTLTFNMKRSKVCID